MGKAYRRILGAKRGKNTPLAGYLGGMHLSSHYEQIAKTYIFLACLLN